MTSRRALADRQTLAPGRLLVALVQSQPAPERCASLSPNVARETYPTITGTWAARLWSTAGCWVAGRSSIVTQPPGKTSYQVAVNRAPPPAARSGPIPGSGARTAADRPTVQCAVRVSWSAAAPCLVVAQRDDRCTAECLDPVQGPAGWQRPDAHHVASCWHRLGLGQQRLQDVAVHIGDKQGGRHPFRY